MSASSPAAVPGPGSMPDIVPVAAVPRVSCADPPVRPDRESQVVPAALATRTRRLMGGAVQVSIGPGVDGRGTASRTVSPEALADRVLDRLAAWAARLTRFEASSELSHLNADPRLDVPVGPTLAAVLDWGRAAEAITDGIVDVTLLDERLRAEGLDPSRGGSTYGPSTPGERRSPGSRSWSLTRGPRGAVVHRPRHVRFDLDGVAKGWLADRALRLVPRGRSALVDADGDIAIRACPGARLEVGVADPRRPGSLLATLRLGGTDVPAGFGVATSGTSVHRWSSAAAAGTPDGRRAGPPAPAPADALASRADGSFAHHLIDPTTRLPARTDVVQATVLAGTAREAEAYAKAAVIAGSAGALALLDRPRVSGAILLTGSGDVLALPSTMRWLG